MIIRPAAVGALLGPCSAAGRGAAQQVDRSTGLAVSRAELQRLLLRLDQASGAADSSPAAQARARDQAGVVRARLTQGDFHAGDRVLLRVESDEPPRSGAVRTEERSVEEQLSDSFVVAPDRRIPLPLEGVISVARLLHAELDADLIQQLIHFLHEPLFHARSIILISDLGGGAQPASCAVPDDD